MVTACTQGKLGAPWRWRRYRRWAINTCAAPAVILAAVVSALPLAHADPAPRQKASLRWVRGEGAEECIAAGAIAHSVVARLKRPVFVTDAEADVRIDARVERRPTLTGGWHAVITLRAPDGTVQGMREIQSSGATCASLDEPLVLVISLLLDPDAPLGPTSPEPAPEAPPPPDVPLPEAPLPEPPKPPAASKPMTRLAVRPAFSAKATPWRFDVQGGLILALGLLPGVGAGMVGRATLTPPGFWGIQVNGAFWPRDEARAGSFGSVFSLAQGGLALCPIDRRVAWIRMNACAGAQIGELRAQGFGFDANAEQRDLLVNVFLQGHARVRPVGPFVISLGLGLGAPLSRARFVYRDAAGSAHDLFRVSAFFGALDAGIGIEIP